jgi:DNA polymerase elongation subunit (family B)
MYQNIHFDRKANRVYLWDDKKGLIQFPFQRYCYIKSPNGDAIALDGTKVKKIYKWDREDEGKGILYESDVHPEVRTLIDLYHDSDEPSLVYKVLYLDIEVDTTKKLPNPEEADNEITAISVYAKDLDQYLVFILDKERKLKDKVEKNVHIHSYTHEEDLLTDFMEWYSNYEPSIITGWNIDFFDIPYLYNRISKVLGKKKGKALSPIGIVEYNNRSRIYNLAGVTCLDYLPLYKKYSMGEEPSYTLDSIATKEVGKGKVKYDGSLDDLFKNDINKFIEYNLNDVVLVKEIDDKLKYIELTRSICHKGHVPYSAIFASSRYLEGAILTYMKELGVIAPDKPVNIEDEVGDDDDEEEDGNEGKFAGAYVKPPVPGRYEWLTCLDATSLYPTTIMTLNISPETKIGKILDWGEINMMSKFNDKKQTKEKYILQYKNGKEKEFTKEELMTLISDKKYRVGANGALYTSENKGLIPAILEKWFQERNDFKGMMKKASKAGDKEKEEYFDRLQYVTKILLNSMYGVLGLNSFRFFDLDNAEAVTLTGQDTLKFADIMGNKWIKDNLLGDLSSYGINLKEKDFCIYSDTDSNYFVLSDFIKRDGSEIETVKKYSAQIAEFINTNLTKFTEKHLNSTYNKLVFKEEAAIKSGFWLKKKRYAYHKIYDLEADKPADKIIVKGLDVVRSNFPPIFRSFMKEILNDILKFESKNSIDDKIVALQTKLTSLGLMDIAKPTSAKNLDKFATKGIAFKKGTPVHIKAALAYNFLLELYKLDTVAPIMSGAKVKWVYLKNNPFNLDGIAFKGYEDPKQIMDFVDKYIDYNKNFESNLLKKLQAFYDALSWGILPRGNEKKITSFFEF